MTDLSRLDVRQAEVCRLVASGVSVKDAALRVHVHPKVIWHWRKRTRGFALRLDTARANSKQKRDFARQERFLELVRGGMPSTRAAPQVGGNMCTVYRWRNTDPTFARRYLELVGATGRLYGRDRVLLDRLRAGDTLADACAEARLCVSTVYYWERRAPLLWAEVQKARAAA